MSAARSGYRAIRVTLTNRPGGDVAFLTVAVKRPTGRWDEWDLLFPAVRTDASGLHSYADVLEAMITALQDIQRMGY